MAPELCLPDVFQQHVTETLVEWSTIRQKASELEHIPHKSAKKIRSKLHQEFLYLKEAL